MLGGSFGKALLEFGLAVARGEIKLDGLGHDSSLSLFVRASRGLDVD
jgi:hypothetical protein